MNLRFSTGWSRMYSFSGSISPRRATRKVIETGESDLIILDELLGLVDLGIIRTEDVAELLQMPGDYKRLYITGNHLADELVPYIDVVCEIMLVKDNT